LRAKVDIIVAGGAPAIRAAQAAIKRPTQNHNRFIRLNNFLDPLSQFWNSAN